MFPTGHDNADPVNFSLLPRDAPAPLHAQGAPAAPGGSGCPGIEGPGRSSAPFPALSPLEGRLPGVPTELPAPTPADNRSSRPRPPPPVPTDLCRSSSSTSPRAILHRSGLDSRACPLSCCLRAAHGKEPPARLEEKKKKKENKKASKPKNTGKRTALSGRAARGAAAAAVPAEPGAHLRGRSGAAPALPLCNGAAAGGAPAARGAAGGRGSAASEPRGWRAELPRRKFAAAPIGYRGFKRLNLFLFPPKFTTVFFPSPPFLQLKHQTQPKPFTAGWKH